MSAQDLWRERRAELPQSEALPFIGQATETSSIWEVLTNPFTGSGTLPIEANPFVYYAKLYPDLENALARPVKGQTYTVFVPIEQVLVDYAKKNEATLISPDTGVKDLLQRHVLGRAVRVSDMPVDELSLPNAFRVFEGRPEDVVRINRASKSFKELALFRKPVIVVNGQKMTVLRTVKASNGIIHLVDQVIPSAESDGEWTTGDPYQKVPEREGQYQPLPIFPAYGPPPLVSVQRAVSENISRQLNGQ